MISLELHSNLVEPLMTPCHNVSAFLFDRRGSVGSERIRARYVVNCAGGASDKVAQMIGDDSFTIKPRLGEYVLLKKSSGDRCVS